MNVPQTLHDNICVLAPENRLDALAAPRFKQAILDAMEQGHIVLVVDFSKVTFMDSSGLGALIASSRALHKQQGEIYLACLNDTIRQIMNLTRADSMFDIFDSTDAAITAFSGREIS